MDYIASYVSMFKRRASGVVVSSGSGYKHVVSETRHPRVVVGLDYDYYHVDSLDFDETEDHCNTYVSVAAPSQRVGTGQFEGSCIERIVVQTDGTGVASLSESRSWGADSLVDLVYRFWR